MTTGQYVTGMEAALSLAGTWTDVTSYVYNRTQPAVTITRGRPDETSQASPSQMTGQLNNRDGRFTSRNPTGPYYPDLNRNTPIRLSVPDSGTYLRMADDTVSWISCPDVSALQLTGNFDVRLDMQPDNYQPAILASKWGATAAAWALVLNGDGTLSWFWFDGSSASTVQSTAPVGLGRVAVRVLFQPDTEALVTFFTAPTMGGSWTQLGNTIGITASDTAASGAGQAVRVGYSATFADGFTAPDGLTYQGLTGKVYELQVYNATPALVADPVFTAQAAGASSFADAQSNTWTVEGTCELSDRSYRFHGEMASLPVAWDPSGRDIWVPFQAGGILRRLGQGNSNVQSPFRRALTAAEGLVAYWPCEDGTGSTQLASAVTGGDPMTIAGTPTLSTDTNFACSAALPEIQTSGWSGAVPAYTSASHAVAFRVLADCPTGLNGNFPLLSLATQGSLGNLDDVTLTYNADSDCFELYGNFQSPSAYLWRDIGIGTLGAQRQWWVSIEMVNSGSSLDVTVNLIAPGTYGLAAFSGSSTYASVNIGNIAGVIVNPTSINLGDFTVGHMSVQSVITPMTDLAQPLDAWAGETAGNRFARLCTENSIAPRVYGFPDTTVLMGAQVIDTLQNLLQSCEAADCGMLYEPRQALGLGYRTLASMCAQAPVSAIDYSLDQAGDQENSPVSLTSVDDDQYTRNDVTVTRTTATTSTGSSYEAVLDDGSAMSISPPPAGIGGYVNSESVSVATDAQLPDIATWLVHVGTVLEERYPQVVTGLHRPPIVAAGIGFTILDADIGDYIAVVNPPAWLPPGTIKQVIAGTTETMSSYLHQVSWNAIPESPYEVALYDDVNYGRADTGGSTLASGVSSTATTLSVATTSALSQLWTTSAGDFPFYIQAGGEQMQVTNITGSSSPQSFTVTRSVNGVVKAQSSGADVRLFYPPVYALT